jgi:glycosyltransferase involved in cell wall biosynthesis
MDRAVVESVLVTGVENPGEGSMLDYALAHEIQPIQIPEMVGEASIKPRDVAALRQLYRLIKSKKPHIVHTHTAKAGFLGRLAAKAAGVPVIIHTYHGHVLRGYYGPLKSRLLTLMEQLMAGISDCIIAVSKETKNDLVALKVCKPSLIEVIPLGFDLRPFIECDRLGGEFKDELGLDSQCVLVGIVGRLFPIKNHRLFLDAAARLGKDHQNVHFVVAGDGILRQDLERYASKLGVRNRVHFLGWRRDLPKIYADLNVLVVSSDNEGTPVAAIEALASGCPVVATRVGGLPTVVKDGVNGYLVPPGKPKELASRIGHMLADPVSAKALGAAGRKMVQRQFSVKRLVRETLTLYQELLEGKKRGI